MAVIALFHTMRELSEPTASNSLHTVSDKICSPVGSLVVGNTWFMRTTSAISVVAELLVYDSHCRS